MGDGRTDCQQRRAVGKPHLRLERAPNLKCTPVNPQAEEESVPEMRLQTDVALVLDKNGGLSNADATFGTLGDPTSWGPGSLERLLEGSATPIAPGSVTITHRTGDPLTESWGADATGHGWVFVDDALAATP